MKNQSAPPWANIRRMIAAKIWPVSEATSQQKQQDQQPQRIIVPAYNPTRILGMAREMRTPRITCGPFYAWMRNHGMPEPQGNIIRVNHPNDIEEQANPVPQNLDWLNHPLPETVPDADWLNSAPIQQSAPVPETHLTSLVLPDWLTAAMPDGTPLAQSHGELFDDVRQPSQPLSEDDAPTMLTERAKKNREFKQAITGLLGQESE